MRKWLERRPAVLTTVCALTICGSEQGAALHLRKFFTATEQTPGPPV